MAISSHEKFRRWKAGELTHAGMNLAIHETHKHDQELCSLFGEERNFLWS